MAEEPKVTREDMVVAISVAKDEISDYVRREGADQQALNRCFAGLDAAVEEILSRWWHPIGTAPRDGTVILAWAAGWDNMCFLSWRDRWDDGSGDSHQDYRPTHWMPPPDPPC